MSWCGECGLGRKKVWFVGLWLGAFFFILYSVAIIMVYTLEFEAIGKWAFPQSSRREEQVIPPASSKNTQDLQPFQLTEDLNAILTDRNILKKNYQFFIKVLAYDRMHSLARCLKSLAVADYAGDTVVLHIFVDHFKLEEGYSSPKSGDEPLKNHARSRTNVLFEDAKESVNSSTREGPMFKDLDPTAGFNKGTVHLTKESTLDSDVAGTRKNALKSSSLLKPKKQASSSLHLLLQNEYLDSESTLPGNLVDEASGSQSSPVQEKLNDFHNLLQYVDQFNWPHGPKEVFVRSHNVGLQSQWLEAWWPTSEDEFAFIVEDDMELSPLFYRFLRGLIANYYYNPANFDPTIYGISLQRSRFVAGKGGKNIHVANNTRLFLYQMVGTWGQLLFPSPWKEFRLWYDNCKSKKLEPFIEGMVTTNWYKKFGQKIWTPWFIKFVYSRGYFNLYTNFLKERALSVSHRDEGVNYKKGAGPDSIIIPNNSIADIDIWEMVPLKSLKKYDFCFHEVHSARFVTGFDDMEIQGLLSSLAVKNKLIFVNFGGTAKALSQNWLCHAAKLGLKNYVIFGDDPIFASDLARRGHAVIQLSTTQLMERFHLPIKDHEALDYVLTDLTLTYLAQHAVQMSYDVWMTSASILWLKDPPSSMVTMDANIHGREVSEEYDSRLLYIRSSNKAGLLWDCVLEEILAFSNSLLNNDQKQDLGKDMLGKALWKCTHGLDVIFKPMEQNIHTSFQNLSGKANVTFLDILTSSERANSSTLLDLINKLKFAGLWMLDHELVCKKVFCQSKLSI